MELLYLLGIFLIAFFSTLISSMSGGGASIIAVPLFLSINISLVLATAIQQVSAIFWVVPAARNYLKGRKIDWKFLMGFSAIGLAGALFGVLFILSIPQRLFQIIVGIIILIMVVYVFFKKGFGLKHEKSVPKWKKIFAYLIALPMGFYETIFGSGNGIFFSFIGVKIKGWELSESLGYYYAIAFSWVFLGASILIIKGYYDLPVMVVAVIGSTLGGYIGSKFARYKGNNFIKILFCLIGLILGLKLLLGI